jgi:hypothetical protein
MITPEWLRQYVSQLIVGVDVLHLHPILFDAPPDEVIFYVKMFATVVEHWVPTQLYG